LKVRLVIGSGNGFVELYLDGAAGYGEVKLDGVVEEGECSVAEVVIVVCLEGPGEFVVGEAIGFVVVFIAGGEVLWERG